MTVARLPVEVAECEHYFGVVRPLIFRLKASR
jgi:hypothetical protein